MLTGIHFLLTYACNFECDHCFLYCSPRSRGTFRINQVSQVLGEAKKIGTVEEIFFEGGEPFLFFPLLEESIRRAKAEGFETGVVTNAYGALSEEDALLWLRPLARAGLDFLSISNDTFHYGEEPDNPAAMALAAARKLGLKASDTVQLIFEDCRIPIENMLGKPGEGFKIAMTGLDCGRIGIASQSVGVAQACLDESIAYMHEREAFGHPISDFQGLRWKVADMALEIEAARLLALNAASLKDLGKKFTQEASMAKLYASEMVNRVAGQAIQIHGGYGYFSEYPMERHYRDARVFTIYEGTSEIQRLVISNNILGPSMLR